MWFSAERWVEGPDELDELAAASVIPEKEQERSERLAGAGATSESDARSEHRGGQRRRARERRVRFQESRGGM